MTFYLQHSLSGGRCPSHAVFPQKTNPTKRFDSTIFLTDFFESQDTLLVKFWKCSFVSKWSFNLSDDKQIPFNLNDQRSIGLTHKARCRSEEVDSLNPCLTKEMDSIKQNTCIILKEAKRCLEFFCYLWGVDGFHLQMERHLNIRNMRKREHVKRKHSFEPFCSCFPSQSWNNPWLHWYGWGLIGTFKGNWLPKQMISNSEPLSQTRNLIRLVKFLADSCCMTLGRSKNCDVFPWSLQLTNPCCRFTHSSACQIHVYSIKTKLLLYTIFVYTAWFHIWGLSW